MCWTAWMLCLFSAMASAASQEIPRRLTPTDVIIKFAKEESRLKELWNRYTYTQHVVFQEIGSYGQVVAERRLHFEIYHTTDGKRERRAVSDEGELLSVRVSPQDIENVVHLQPFSLTYEDLPNYTVQYVDRERVDELDTYVFDVRPRRAAPGQRYFQGRIWVEEDDFQIVKTLGKPVPEPKSQKFPTFETVRQQIDGRHWFPVWTGSDETLKFDSGNEVRFRQRAVYKDYQQFEVGVAVEFEETAEKKTPEPPPA